MHIHESGMQILPRLHPAMQQQRERGIRSDQVLFGISQGRFKVLYKTYLILYLVYVARLDTRAGTSPAEAVCVEACLPQFQLALMNPSQGTAEPFTQDDGILGTAWVRKDKAYCRRNTKR